MGKKEKRNDPTAVDGEVSAGLQQVLSDLEKVFALQKADPDNMTDPVDRQVWAHLEDVKGALQQVILDQAKDGSPDARVAALLREVRAATGSSVRVKSEPRQYTEHGKFSYFRDLATRGYDDGAEDRLRRHANEIDVDLRSGNEYVKRALGEIRRGESETRAVSTAAGSDGVFVTPQYLVDKWITYRSPDRSFTNQCVNLPLPTYGITFDIPAFTNYGAAGQQSTENTGIDAASPTSAYRTVTLDTFAGYVPVSQQLLDRGGFQGTGGTFDVIIIQQSQNLLYAQVDEYLMIQALAGAYEVNQSTAATITQFWLDLATARNNLADELGVKLPGTHAFSTSDFFGWMSSQVDNQGRPIVLPDAAAMVSRDGDPTYSGWTGLFLPGNLKYFADDNLLDAAQSTTIGVPSTETAILVGSPSDMLVWIGDMIPFTAQQTFANELSVLCGLRQYAAAIPRHAEAFSYITGSGYLAADLT